MRFSEVLAGIRADGDSWIGTVGEDWLQGRSAFGGLQGALALHAMRACVEPTVRLRALQVTFIGPVPAGEVRISARVLRQGKNVTQVEARLLDGDTTACLAIGIFGASRESSLHLMPSQPPVVAAENPPVLPHLPGVVPAFASHFDARWLSGDLPFTGSKNTKQVVEASLKDAGVADEAHVLAFADFIPPVALALLKKPTPGSSLTWMLELFADARGLSLDRWRIDAHLQAAEDGYTSQQVMLWGPGGEPVALSRQSMVVFA